MGFLALPYVPLQSVIAGCTARMGYLQFARWTRGSPEPNWLGLKRRVVFVCNIGKDVAVGWALLPRETRPTDSVLVVARRARQQTSGRELEILELIWPSPRCPRNRIHLSVSAFETLRAHLKEKFDLDTPSSGSPAGKTCGPAASVI